MSVNPFAADAAKRVRYAELNARIGHALSAEIGGRTANRTAGGDNLGSVLLAQEAADLVGRFGLNDIADVMVLGLDAAKRLARPPISNFFVGAIGLEAETGNLILGGNVEFSGTTLATTLHGEGFVFTRGFSRGMTISTIAIGEAHPCAHCRQYLSEFAASKDLRLIDPLGHDLSMADLYPWPFDPNYLGEPGIVTGALPFPDLEFAERPPGDPQIAEMLLATGRRAHTPYGKCPAGVVLRLADGRCFSGSTIESVAFNPSMGPLQGAIVDMLAHGGVYADIKTCWLGHVADGQVRHERSVAELLAAIAPQADLQMHGWRL